MNIAMTLTLDGLVRALRRTAHDLADDADHGYRPRPDRHDSARPEGRPMPAGMDDDDRADR